MPNTSVVSSTVKVIHDADDLSFFAYADKDMLGKWRVDKTIPLVDVVQSFNVYQSENKSTQGIECIAGKADLKNHFGYDDPVSCIEQILAKGKEQVMPRAVNKGHGGATTNGHHTSR
ncbi:hypothetical protein HDU83_004479 [Entophlyctis luteolus]|nr:hypothetical protein HDU83_004479 [Entophlyctis luteolus]